MSKWAPLPPQVTPSAWRAVQGRLQAEMRSLLADAGFQFRIRGSHVLTCSRDPGPLVYATPLQNSAGALRADIDRKLKKDTFPGPGLQYAIEEAAKVPGFNIQNIDYWMSLQIAFLQEGNPAKAVRDLCEAQPKFRFYRLGATRAFMLRQFVWRIIGHLINEIPAAQMPLGSARRDNMLVTGLLEAAQGSLLCAPLTARFQPLAAVLMTRIGSEVAVLPHGSGYVRTPSMGGWPVGMGRPSLSGRGKGIYKTGIKTFPPGHAAAILERSVSGANRLLSKFTDPTEFLTNGLLDCDEQTIAWANMRFGIDAINSMGSEWGKPEAIWSAFRALGTLQGIWEGGTQGGVPLWELLSPARIRDHVLPELDIPAHRSWAAGIIGNYEAQLVSGFPGQTLEEAARHVQELRHLVHGVGGQGRRPRDARLAALRLVSENEPNIQLVCNVASLWWTAALFSPDKIARPGRAPWQP
ncbi:hypothetical protein ACGF0J_11205 [Nonomuraea sp. NPDC047897]|uniref:hypothetical protein n=1 Tax=Nonomuraea sp. NPDC047897 TaxID=3364346 RepID=UPI00370F8E17